jgi:hypothetical protein
MDARTRESGEQGWLMVKELRNALMDVFFTPDNGKVAIPSALCHDDFKYDHQRAL